MARHITYLAARPCLGSQCVHQLTSSLFDNAQARCHPPEGTTSNAQRSSELTTPYTVPRATPPAAFDTLATIAVHTSATAASAGHLLDDTKSPQQCNKQLYDTPRICFTNHIYPIKRPNHYQGAPYVHVRPGQWRVRGPSASLFLSPANLTTIRLNLVHRQWRFKSERLSRNLLNLFQVYSYLEAYLHHVIPHSPLCGTLEWGSPLMDGWTLPPLFSRIAPGPYFHITPRTTPLGENLIYTITIVGRHTQRDDNENIRHPHYDRSSLHSPTPG